MDEELWMMQVMKDGGGSRLTLKAPIASLCLMKPSKDLFQGSLQPTNGISLF